MICPVNATQAILSWNPPTTNADGTPLTDLAGYKVYYGTTLPRVYGSPVDVGNVTTYIASNLLSGATYYFAVTAYDISGNESSYSNEARKTIPDTTYTGDSVRMDPDPDIAIQFSSVTQSGTVTATNSGIGPPLPLGFDLGNKPLYYELATTAIFTGSVEVCFNYKDKNYGNENMLRLFHFSGGAWEDITKSGYPDTVNNIICGTTTSFSPFVIAQEASTAVTLSNFSSHLAGDDVVITWSTASEINNEGFTILRGESASGSFTTITPSMIPAMGGPGMNATYTFTDNNVTPGKTYYYQLQDIDSRGRITAHQGIPVTVAVARVDENSHETTSQKDDAASGSAQSTMAGGKDVSKNESKQSDNSATLVSVVMSDQKGKSPEAEIDTTKRLTEDVTSISSRDDKTVPQDIQSQERSISENVLSLRDMEASYPSSGPSSFSVSIEDDKGNIIMISRVEDTKGTSTSTRDLMATEESGRVVLTWQGKGKVKGFILHRAEKGTDNYAPISNLIPYFGQDDKDVLFYRFIDKTVKRGVKYDYRLEIVDADYNTDLKIGKLTN